MMAPHQMSSFLLLLIMLELTTHVFLLSWDWSSSRISGTSSICFILANIKSYVSIVHQIMLNSSMSREDDDNIINPIAGLNSAVKTSLSNTSASAPKQKKDKYELTVNGRCCASKQHLSGIVDVLRFFCLNNGCRHALKEWILSTGEFETPPVCNMPCKDACLICSNEWQKMYLGFYKEPLSVTSYALPNFLWDLLKWI